MSASSVTPFSTYSPGSLSENRGLLQGRGNPFNLNHLQRGQHSFIPGLLWEATLSLVSVVRLSQGPSCQGTAAEGVVRGLGEGAALVTQSSAQLITTHIVGPFSSFETPQITNAYPLKSAKSGNNLLFSFTKREIKSFRHLPPALEESVGKWTIFNYTPRPTGTQKQRPKDWYRQYSSESWQGQGSLTTLRACPRQYPCWQNRSSCGTMEG